MTIQIILIFTAERMYLIILSGFQARDHLATPETGIYLPLMGDEVLIHPQEEDFQTHRKLPVPRLNDSRDS